MRGGGESGPEGPCRISHCPFAHDELPKTDFPISGSLSQNPPHPWQAPRYRLSVDVRVATQDQNDDREREPEARFSCRAIVERGTASCWVPSFRLSAS